jgi:hypothetical protein
MIVYPQRATLYLGSYYAVNMIHTNDIWVFMLLILGILIECRTRLNIEMGAFALKQI